VGRACRVQARRAEPAEDGTGAISTGGRGEMDGGCRVGSLRSVDGRRFEVLERHFQRPRLAMLSDVADWPEALYTRCNANATR
jgi:hypothetical protein